MPELSNLIRQRLGAARVPATHPDADLVSAYAEGGLPPQERADLTRHLAVCAHCRELLALSMPEAVAAAAAIPLKPRDRSWGAYVRMAASLAMVVVAVLLLVKETHHAPAARIESAQTNTAQTVPPSAPPQSNEAAPSVTVARVAPALAANNEASAAKRPARTTPVRNSEPQPESNIAEIRQSAQTVEVANAAVSQDYINNQVLANQLFLTDQAQQKPSLRELPSAPSPAVARQQKNMFLAGGVTSGSGFVGIPAESGQQKVQSLSSVSIFHDSVHHGLSITSTISRVSSELRLKRPQISSQNANAYAMFRPGLERSADAQIASQAKSSENLKQSPAFTGLAMAAPSRAQAPMFLWRIVQGKLLKSSDMSNWLEGYPASEGIDFSVVRSTGPEVWAGGNNAAVVHSSDSGLKWQRVILGAAATGDITSIEINGNGQNIQVTSSSGQSWASQDGGKTWMLVN